jgi:hypothetical protein
MSIQYTYEIIKVDEAARCMEVVYSAEGHQTMHIGARLPFEGEALEDVIKAFAPVPLWLELATPVTVPRVGAAGTVTPEPETPVSEMMPFNAEIPTIVV